MHDEFQFYDALSRRPRDFSLRGTSGIPSITARLRYSPWNDATHEYFNSDTNNDDIMTTVVRDAPQGAEASLNTQDMDNRALIPTKDSVDLSKDVESRDEIALIGEGDTNFNMTDFNLSGGRIRRRADVPESSIGPKKVKLKHRWWFDMFRAKDAFIQSTKTGSINPAITIEDVDIESQVSGETSAADDHLNISNRKRSLSGSVSTVPAGRETEDSRAKTLKKRRRSSALSAASGKLFSHQIKYLTSLCI